MPASEPALPQGTAPQPASASPPTATSPTPASLPPTQPQPTKKRQRQLMDKGDRKNKKLWAVGAREAILLPHLAKFTEELAKSSKHAKEYRIKVCHEFNVKIPYDLPDEIEPKMPLPEYNPANPPPLPPLSEEEEKVRAEALCIRDKRIHDWLTYRARKVIPATAKGSTDTSNAFAMYMMNLTGISGAPKKARQGWQQYQHENPEYVQESAQRAWEQESGGDQGGQDSDEDADDEAEEDDDLEEGEEGGGEGVAGAAKKTKKTVGFISAHARKLFAALGKPEQDALRQRARAEKLAAQRRWEQALDRAANPSQLPEDVQQARAQVPGFLSPILNGLHDHTANAHVLVLVGGREPESGGQIKVNHYSVGVNKQNVHFPAWNAPRFNREILGFFGEYLNTVWDEDDCAKMALRAGGASGEDDVLKSATFQFDDEEGGDGAKADDVSASDGGGEETRPRKRTRRGESQVASVPQSTEEAEAGLAPADGSEHGMESGDYVPLELPPPLPVRPRPRPTRKSTRIASAVIPGQQVSGGSEVHIPPQPILPPPDLTGIPIDPALLRPPYGQAAAPPTPVVAGSVLRGRIAPKALRLDLAGSRPKEISAWIGAGRWRSGGEPVKKNGKFALSLMNAWWAWYLKLVPDWRDEDERGRLEEFVTFGEGMGKLDVPGVNGILSLVVALKWVGQALTSKTDIFDRARVDDDWRRAAHDLAKMLEGMAGRGK
ncbi:hypothetical protein EV714DRAFT_240490 [Schizophyllum commune]